MSFKIKLQIHEGINDTQSIRAFRKLPDQFKTAHGLFYDYSKFVYYGAAIKSIIICPIHGEFLQPPKEHKRYGCRLCGIDKSAKAKVKTTKWFIEEAIRVHGDTYDYSNTVYHNSTTKVKIRCKEHGEFEQGPYHHIKGSGCQICAEHKRLADWLDLPTTLYYVSITKGDTTLYKVGITTKDLSYRFRCEIKEGYKVQIIDTYKYSTGYLAYKLEQFILRKFKEYRYRGDKFLYRGFGDSELLTKDIVNELKELNLRQT